jgi:hypothetical protein
MCRNGCPTKDHRNWGECARAAAFQIGDLGSGVKRHVDLTLNSYAKARSLGLQPEGTSLSKSQGVLRAAGA